MSALLADLHLLRPQWLLLILPAALLCLLLWRARRYRGSWERAVAPELLAQLLQGSPARQRRLAIPGLFAAWCIASLAAAGPSWRQLPQPVLQKQDALVIIMDLSYSLLATDLSPSRNDAARRKLLDLLRQRREGLTGLVAYAGDAHIVAPLTDDNPTIANLLPALSPDMMPLPGSDPVDGVERALELLESAGVRRGRLLLVTDGIGAEDRQQLAARLQRLPHRLAILGVGTDVGAPIPLPEGGFLKNAAGDIVIPALDPQPLRALAADTGGAYRRLSVDDSDLRALLAATDGGRGEDTVRLDRRADAWQDMGHWLVLALLPLVLALFRRGFLYGLALLALLPPQPVAAASWRDLWLRPDQQALQTLERGDAAAAAQRFDDPAWRGTAAFRAGDYAAAQQAFGATDGADAWYNRGNALAAAGRLEDALEAYREVLAREPQAQDAQRNIAAIERLLEERERQQQQQNPQDREQQRQDREQPSQQGPQPDQGQQQAGGSGAGDDGERQRGSAGDAQHGERAGSDAAGRGAQREAESAAGAAPAPGGDAQDDEARALEGMPTPDIDNSAMQQALERDQAVEQWLRRVPDDPSGLLREKFRYESRQRRRNGEQPRDEQIW